MSGRFFESEGYRNRDRVFADRAEAGQMLAEMLAPEYVGLPGGLVLAIPSGGVPVALEVCRRLRLPLDLIIARKLQIPGNTEAGFGAMAMGGEVLLNEPLVSSLGLTKAQIEAEQGRVEAELAERNALLRGGRPLPDMYGRTAIIVDDGLASGYTMQAAVRDLRARGAAGITVAVPTAPLETARRMADISDAVYCISIQDYYPFAVASAYRNWRDLSREEVADMLGQTKCQMGDGKG
ncbi:phosphoribosyltransferase [Desulfocurvibacter africanus]|uniref:Phosphoribosyltransferase n=1 Tax=Desulfocurvibacter africanus subsp. africanus str. Walvis Bay TaxID=690850 RepID=F3Z0E4_DESAF|nr:phosphoribosyltransferase family protein [Desulfocurvibacter africanus]EGJ50954.1 phosphoribosyltransferase [Desulfocurvibacter africanus subsp. africanus str. Walvis Bay]